MMKDVEKEIEVMKALRGNPWIVEYLGSEVRRTASTAGHGSGWEVFILMEFCSGTSSLSCGFLMATVSLISTISMFVVCRRGNHRSAQQAFAGQIEGGRNSEHLCRCM